MCGWRLNNLHILHFTSLLHLVEVSPKPWPLFHLPAPPDGGTFHSTSLVWKDSNFCHKTSVIIYFSHLYSRHYTALQNRSWGKGTDIVLENTNTAIVKEGTLSFVDILFYCLGSQKISFPPESQTFCHITNWNHWSLNYTCGRSYVLASREEHNLTLGPSRFSSANAFTRATCLSMDSSFLSWHSFTGFQSSHQCVESHQHRICWLWHWGPSLMFAADAEGSPSPSKTELVTLLITSLFSPPGIWDSMPSNLTWQDPPSYSSKTSTSCPCIEEFLQ